MIRDFILVICSMLIGVFLIKNSKTVRDFVLNDYINSDYSLYLKQEYLNNQLAKKDSIINVLILENSKQTQSIKSLDNNLTNLNKKLIDLQKEKRENFNHYTNDQYFDIRFREDSIVPSQVIITADSSYVFTGFQAKHIRKIWEDKLEFQINNKYLLDKNNLLFKINNYQLEKITYLEKDIQNKSEIITVTNSKLKDLKEKYYISSSNEKELQKALNKANRKNTRLQALAYLGGASVVGLIIKTIITN